MKSVITLKHISDLIGYSRSTISKALNNGDDICDQTKNKIRAIAKKYNYSPNSNAVALRSKKSRIIGILVPMLENSVYIHLISEFQKRCFKIGYKLIILQSFNSLKTEIECRTFINDGTIDGLMIFDSKGDAFNSNYSVPTLFINSKSDEWNSKKCQTSLNNYFKSLLLKIN